MCGMTTTPRRETRNQCFLVHIANTQIHEDSPRCPYCENYISKEDTLPARKPWWIYVGAVLAFYVVYRWIAG